MSETRKPGMHDFCWAELGTSDRAAAQVFYSELLGWSMQETPAGEMGVYTMLFNADREVGGLYELSPQMREQGVPPNWLPYVKVEDVDAVAARVGAAGGKVVMPAMDVMDVGRMAVLSDPEGATFAIWQARSHEGAAALGEPGSMCWNELNARDGGRAAAFYSTLFGWSEQTMDLGGTPYRMMQNGPSPACGVLQMNEQWEGVPSHWMTYFAVEDCDATAERATALGAQVCVPPTDIPSVGRFSVITDPQGAAFSVIRLAPKC